MQRSYSWCRIWFKPKWLKDLQVRSSEARDNEVAQLKASLANMQEKFSSFEEMKERLSQFDETEQRMAHMLQQMQQITSQCSQVGNNVCLIPLIMLFPCWVCLIICYDGWH